MQKHKNLILVIVVLGVITALATTVNFAPLSNLFGNKASDVYLEDMSASPRQLGGVMMDGAPVEIGMGMMDSKMAETSFYPGYNPDYALEVDQRVYEKSSNHSVVVGNVSDYTKQIKEYLLSIEGRIISSNSGTTEMRDDNPFTDDKYHYAYIYAKVPVEKFEEVQNKIVSGVKNVISESIDSQDQTAQLLNTQDNVESLQNRKLELEIQLEEATTDLEKKRLELQISRIEDQIKNAEKQAVNAEQRVEYANVSISVADNEKYFNPGYPVGFIGEIFMALGSAGTVMSQALKLAIWVLVYGIIWLPIVLILRWILGMRKKKEL